MGSFGEDYEQLFVHGVMLRDTVRCEAYRSALEKVVRPGDVVLDVGAGTGIMSIFAARAGARKVYAVERTTTADMARWIAERNRLSDVIEVIENDMEEARIGEKVDVVVSEWLGGYGVDENLLPAVLVARDRWLKPGGKMIPERVSAWMAPALDRKLDEEQAFWKGKPYGVDLGPIAEARSQELEFCRHHVGAGDLVADPGKMWEVDGYSIGSDQAEEPFECSLVFRASRKGKFNSLAAWFSAGLAEGVILTNAPDAPRTHWGRWVFPLEDSIGVEPGTRIDVDFVCEPAGQGYAVPEWSVRVGGEHSEVHNVQHLVAGGESESGES